MADKGVLYLVTTPIGHLGDMSLRAIETLRRVDMVASEDTRKTGHLLKHFEIGKPQVAFHEHNERKAGPRIVRLLEEGRDVALVTSAGTPGISDPGFTLVRLALEAGIEVTMIPGPCALVMAVVLSGLPVHSFTFKGFAPRTSGKRRRFLEMEKDSPHTLVFYESPYRVKAFLAEALEVYGNRRAAVAKELTKMFESVRRGRIEDQLAGLDDSLKGEYVIVIGAAECDR